MDRASLPLMWYLAMFCGAFVLCLLVWLTWLDEKVDRELKAMRAELVRFERLLEDTTTWVRTLLESTASAAATAGRARAAVDALQRWMEEHVEPQE